MILLLQIRWQQSVFLEPTTLELGLFSEDELLAAAMLFQFTDY